MTSRLVCAVLRVTLCLTPALAVSAAQSPAADAPSTTAAPQPRPDGKPHTFAVAGGQFVLDGKPFRVISGEMHYPRIPREYWRARLRMARAMGLNAVTTYVFWNEHEPTPGVYDFSGNNDVAEFIREAQQEGLYVILRPGPYVCAEWEFGGYPAWLLKNPTTVVRSQDPKFMEPATRWLKRLGQELAPLQVGNGGPIVLVQVENEYGSFGNDHVYMEQNRQALLDAGFSKAQLYTADGTGDIANGSLPELPVGINFDGNKPGSAQKAFATLKTKRPDGPFFNSEFWAGWFDHWGSQHAHTNTETQVANLAWMLEQGYSVSIYMFHGGTDFGWMNGANSSDSKKDYEPDVTSYDYDAALDESGRPTAKYFAFRDAIAKATGVTPPAVPDIAPPIVIPRIRLAESASLWDHLPKPIESPAPLTMEDIGQAYGYILYRTELKSDVTGPVAIDSVHDAGSVYLGRKLTVGPPSPGRQNGPTIFALPVVQANDTAPRVLNILIENSGRINYSHQLRTDRKGIIGQVYAPYDPAAQEQTHPVTGWQIYPLPMTMTGATDPSALPYKKGDCAGPCFYRASFTIAQPGDTFLDASKLGKGQLWVNGHALGRFWNIGPQKTLYLPGPWLKRGTNELIVFDLEGAPGATVEGLAAPDLGK